MEHGVYIGIRRRLRGKGALLKRSPGGWEAQFDDRTTRLGYGWHWFPHGAFRVEDDNRFAHLRYT